MNITNFAWLTHGGAKPLSLEKGQDADIKVVQICNIMKIVYGLNYKIMKPFQLFKLNFSHQQFLQ